MESEVVAPSDMMALGDSLGEGCSLPAACMSNRYGRIARMMPASSEPPHGIRNKVNVAFCDGHVESQTLRFVFQSTDDAALVRWNRDHLSHREGL